MTDKISIFDGVTADATNPGEIENPTKKLFTSKPRIEDVAYHIVAKWSINSVADTCGICRENLVSLCLNCQSYGYGGDSDCLVAKGLCNHVYHLHCMNNWLKKQPVCPLCSKDWEMISADKFIS